VRPARCCDGPRRTPGRRLQEPVRAATVYSGEAGPQAIDSALTWLNPFALESTEALTAGVLLAVLLHWGWDSTVSVNEESERPSTMPGRAAVVSTLVLLAIYVLVAVAAQAFNGPAALVDAEDALGVLATGVFGAPLDKVVISGSSSGRRCSASARRSSSGWASCFWAPCSCSSGGCSATGSSSLADARSPTAAVLASEPAA